MPQGAEGFMAAPEFAVASNSAAPSAAPLPFAFAVASLRPSLCFCFCFGPHRDRLQEPQPARSFEQQRP